MSEVQFTVEYREVPGFPGYRVGDDGSMLSCWHRMGRGGGYANRITNHWHRMKLRINTKGYWSVNLVQESGERAKTFRVHRLVLLAFVGPCPKGMECRHLNGIRVDCSLTNLAWGTKAENTEDRRKHANHSPRIRLYTHDSRTLPLKDWAREFRIPYTCLYQRVTNLDMTFEEAIARPYCGVASNGGHWKKRSTD